MHSRLLIAAIAGLATSLLVQSAKAATAQTEPDFDPSHFFVFRLEPPFLGVIGDGGGTHDWNVAGITVFGGSLGARFARLYEVEVGASFTEMICESGNYLHVRTGLSPSLVRARADGTHWNLRFPLLLGFLTSRGTPNSCDESPAHDLVGMLFSTGLEATHWSNSALGFNMRLLFGIGPGWSKETGSYVQVSRWTSADKIMEVGLSIGLAFR